MLEMMARLNDHFDGLNGRYACFADPGFQSEGSCATF
jgi:hypothetical protein